MEPRCADCAIHMSRNIRTFAAPRMTCSADEKNEDTRKWCLWSLSDRLQYCIDNSHQNRRLKASLISRCPAGRWFRSLHSWRRMRTRRLCVISVSRVGRSSINLLLFAAPWHIRKFILRSTIHGRIHHWGKWGNFPHQDFDPWNLLGNLPSKNGQQWWISPVKNPVQTWDWPSHVRCLII